MINIGNKRNGHHSRGDGYQQLPHAAHQKFLNNSFSKEIRMKRRLFLSSMAVAAMASPLIANAQPGPGPGAGPGAGKGPGAGPGAGPGPGAGAGKGGMGMRRWSRERMFGSPMMTLEERQEHQRQMWNAKTVEERNKIRDEHRKQMLERAKQQNFKVDEKQDDLFSVPSISQ